MLADDCEHLTMPGQGPTNNDFVSHREFSEFKTDVDQRFDRIDGGIRSLADKIDSRGQVNWGWITAGITLMFTAILWMTGQQNAVFEGDIKRVDEKLTTEMDAQDEALADTKQGLQRLDSSLQREMRDLDSVASVRLDQLDTVLQREFNLSLAPIAKAVDDLHARMLKDDERELRDAANMFQMADHDAFREREFEPLEKRVNAIESSRWGRDDGLATRERLARLEAIVEAMKGGGL
ncbi:MAG: DUF16 domain-containing protein [Myxococcales bacterium FL481]|nr:MAG: DUF16 domain-containing protein [Myxococcales bacterium FL481]